MFLAICQLYPAYGQQINPEADALFRETEVTEIHVTLGEEDKEFLLANANRFSETYVMADVSFTNSQLKEARISNVGIRLRGNTSRGHLKRSFKIDFQEFGGNKFLGHKKVNLKPNVNDPSVVRELLTMHLYRKMSVPAARIAPAALYFNDEYMGVYLMVEQIDDEFVDRRFGHEEGFLYKARWGASLENNNQITDTDLYESKMNEDEDRRTELAHFVETLNSSGDGFQKEIQRVFQVDRYIRQLAVEAITGHWDGYSYNMNNYYLFYDEFSGKFEFIVYDTDNTWGIDWVNRDWGTRDLDHFHRHGHPRPLTSGILEIPDWRNRYYACLNKVMEFYFNPEQLDPMLQNLTEVLDPYVAMDEKFDASFGFTYQDFKSAFDAGAIDHVKYGLKEFVEVRRSSALASIPEVDSEQCHFSDVSVFPNPSSNGEFKVISKEDADPGISVYDQLGKPIPFVKGVNNGTTTIHLEQRGFYFMRVNSKVFRVLVD